MTYLDIEIDGEFAYQSHRPRFGIVDMVGIWITGTLDKHISSLFFVPTKYYYSFDSTGGIAYIYDQNQY